MVNRKQRLVKNLYNATPALSQPQMPVPTEKEYSSCSENSKYHHKPDSGTCNACSAPSSTCSRNQILMASKVDECSGEASSENALSYSVNDAIPINKGVHSETAPKPRTRNFASGSSSNTSENVDCEGSCRNSDLSATSEIVSVLPKLEDLRVEGDHGDHQSCVTGIANSRMSHFSLSNGDNADSSNYPLSANTSSAQESVSVAPLQTNPESFGVRCNINESENSSKRQRVKSEDNLKEVTLPVSSSAGLSSQNPGLFESCSDTVEGANPRSNAEGNLLHSALLKNSSGDGISSPKGEDIVNIQTDPLAKNLEVVKNEGSENAEFSLSNVKENHLESPSMEEDDDSDLVLHDVKVCDICGDAGREDLLAICSRCSDGAEHTYCMREMLDKVPSGDWLCEECQFGVQIKGRNQDTVDIVEGSAKMNSSGQANSESSSGNKKSLAKVSDIDENRNGNGPTSKILGKRRQDDVEVSIPAKRRIRESDKGSVNLSTSSVVPAVSRNSSFKHNRLTKTNQHSSSSSLVPPESANCSASASRPHTQGSFIKSNSFNSLNVKPKVNCLDDVVPQKQRSVRDSATLDRKEGALRSIRKSVSFKSPNMSRFNPGESKVKLLSHVPDIKGSKNSKDRTIYERKNSFQSERLPMTNSAGPGAKNDQKLVSSVETNSLNSSRKFRDVKVVPSDARPTPLSRSSSFAARKGSEPSVSQGEGKRQFTTSMVGVPFKNTDNNQFAMPNIEKLKTSAGQISADRPFSNANESFPDSLSQQKESVDFGEKVNDSSSRRSKQIREGLDSKDKLKAAIEAAVLKKPGIYRKHRRPDQGSDTSLAGINSEVAGQVLLSDSNIKGNVPLLSEMIEDHMALEIVDDVKQFPVVSSDGSSFKPEESCPVVPLEGVSLGSNIASHVSEGISTFYERLAIPDIEHIWKGVFEVHRVGRTINLFDGIQAHLSACASPKVLEAVNKFDQKVILNEVPRLTSWPMQFQENGVREENIAVFFFAKDSNSYEKSYKVLLNNMMKNDVALCGNFDGFELLIFPSNQLPEKTQRWNTLYFMWGVFRGKRVNKHVLGSDEQTSVPQGSPTASMSFPFSRSADMQGDRGIAAGSIGSPASEIRTSELTSLSSGEELKEGCIGRVSSDVMNIDPVRTEQLSDNRLNLRSFSPVHSSAAKSCGETADNDDRRRHSIISQEDRGHGGYKSESELEVCAESADRGCVSNESQQIPVNCGPDLNSPHSSCGASAHEMGSVGIDGEVGSTLGKMYSMVYEARARDGFRHTSASVCGTEMLKEHTKVALDSISQKEAWISPKDTTVEPVRTTEKQKSGLYGLEGGHGLLPRPTNGNADNGGTGRLLACDYSDNGGSRDDFSGERFFFPVVPLPEEELGRRVELKMSGEEEQFEKKAPNLELALWGGKDELNLNLEAEEAAAEAGSKGGEEDDLSSASLSLSLSFPFPEAEPRLSRSSEEESAGDVNTCYSYLGWTGK